MGAIDTIVATTITVSEQTRRRLADYKHGDDTFDEVLNRLMDKVPLADDMAELIAEHERRLADFQGVPADEFMHRLRKEHGMDSPG